MFSNISVRALAFAGAALTMAAASPAMAAILTTSTRASNFSSATTGPVALPLNDTGGTTLLFNTTTANQKVRIIYNAECGVIGTTSAWVSAVITVDGADAKPASSTQFAMCSANSTTDYQWVGAVRQSVITVPSIGTHKLVVYGQLNYGATQFWQGDASIVVDSN